MKNLKTREQLNEATDKPLRFKSWNVKLDLTGKYRNGRTAIQLNDAHDGEPIAVATVNLPEVQIKDNEVIIKDYSENSGMLDFLMKNGIVKAPTREVQSGHVTCPVCELI